MGDWDPPARIGQRAGRWGEQQARQRVAATGLAPRTCARALLSSLPSSTPTIHPAALFSQALLTTLPFAVAVYMVRDFEAARSGGAAVSEQAVGRATGLLAAVFCAAQLLTSFPWGLVSDRIGRKVGRPWSLLWVVSESGEVGGCHPPTHLPNHHAHTHHHHRATHLHKHTLAPCRPRPSCSP